MICKYYKKGNCHLQEMEDTQPCGVPELDRIHPCPFHPSYDNYCFDDAMKQEKE